MKKYLLLLTTAASVALVGCTSDNFVGETTVENPEEQVAIDFGSNTQAKTRAGHAESAELLGGKFYIFGQKTSSGTTSLSSTTISSSTPKALLVQQSPTPLTGSMSERPL